MKSTDRWIITRRDFLKSSIIAGLSTAIIGRSHRISFSNTGLRFGIVTDAHYADADPQFNRYFRESIDKMTECVELMNEQEV